MRNPLAHYLNFNSPFLLGHVHYVEAAANVAINLGGTKGEEQGEKKP